MSFISKTKKQITLILISILLCSQTDLYALAVSSGNPATQMVMQMQASIKKAEKLSAQGQVVRLGGAVAQSLVLLKDAVNLLSQDEKIEDFKQSLKVVKDYTEAADQKSKETKQEIENLLKTITLPELSQEQKIDFVNQGVEELNQLEDGNITSEIKQEIGKYFFQEDFMTFVPDELKVEILQYLTKDELVRISTVSEEWKRLSNDPVLWKRLFERDFSDFLKEDSSEDIKKLISHLNLLDLEWKENYRKLIIFRGLENPSLDFYKLDFKNYKYNETDFIAIIARLLGNDKTLTSFSNKMGGGTSFVGVKYIIEALKTNTSLTSLDLNDNGLGDIGVQYLAEALKTNNTLTSLNLSSNDISADGAKYLAEALKINNTLTSLNLGWNDIRCAGAQYLAEALKINKKLKSLGLNCNHYIGDVGAKSLAGALKVNNTLTGLGLNWVEIGNEGAKDLAEALKENSTLVHLYLNANLITHVGAKDLAGALKENNTLTDLYLSGNQIKDAGAKDLAEALKDNNALTHLWLSGNQIRYAGAKSLAEVLKVNNTLTYFDLSSNLICAVFEENGTLRSGYICVAGIKALAEALKVNNSMIHLDLSNNNLYYDGAKYLSEALKTNKSLTFLGLKDNDIGDRGVKEIVEMLKLNNALIYLDLSSNQIHNVGAKDISGALKHNNSLINLNLGSNQISVLGAKYLAEALELNNTLTHFNLSSNAISAVFDEGSGFLGFDYIYSVGFEAIAEALKINNTLTNLDLCGNKIGFIGAKKITEALEVNNILINIELDWHQITDETVKSIKNLLERNKELTKVKSLEAKTGIENNIKKLKLEDSSLTPFPTEHLGNKNINPERIPNTISVIANKASAILGKKHGVTIVLQNQEPLGQNNRTDEISLHKNTMQRKDIHNETKESTTEIEARQIDKAKKHPELYNLDPKVRDINLELDSIVQTFKDKPDEYIDIVLGDLRKLQLELIDKEAFKNEENVWLLIDIIEEIKKNKDLLEPMNEDSTILSQLKQMGEIEKQAEFQDKISRLINHSA